MNFGLTSDFQQRSASIISRFEKTFKSLEGLNSEIDAEIDRKEKEKIELQRKIDFDNKVKNRNSKVIKNLSALLAMDDDEISEDKNV